MKHFSCIYSNYGWSPIIPSSKTNKIDNNLFSRSLGTWEFGDAVIVDKLAFDGIYLISAAGNVYLYEGIGTFDGKTHAETETELEQLGEIYTGLTQPAK